MLSEKYLRSGNKNLLKQYFADLYHTSNPKKTRRKNNHHPHESQVKNFDIQTVRHDRELRKTFIIKIGRYE